MAQAKDMYEKLEEFNKEKDKIQRGNPEAVRRQHEKGKLTARERIDRLSDANSFDEMAMWRRNGVVAGFAEVNNRPVTVWAHDVTEGTTQSKKIETAAEYAARARTPIVGIFDYLGERGEQALQSTDYFSAARIAHTLTSVSGVIPKISLVMGECSGELSIVAGLSDFTFMVRNTSYMHLMPPPQGMTGQELGDAWNVHAKVTGCCDVLAEDDEDCLKKCRQLLSFLPSHNKEMPPVVDTGDDPNRREEELMEIVPVDSTKPYSMYDVLSLIIDNGEFFETKRYWTTNLITGFARLGGHSVGILANNPQDKGGCMTLDAADKMSRHVRFCDAFNIPIIWISDTPAFLPAVEEETRGLIRHGAGCVMSNYEATVPMITLGIRKMWGGGGLAMGPNRDLLLAWPTFETGTMKPEASVKMRYKRELEAITDETKRNKREVELIALVQKEWDMRAARSASDTIDPRDTRPYLIKALKWLKDKKDERAPRKHENIRI